MGLVTHAQHELKSAGLLDGDSDYNGMVGQAVLELIEVFAGQGHSGMSAHMTIELFARAARYQLLSPLANPALTGEFIEVDGAAVLQSTRKCSVFSADGGKTWYDLDGHVPWWKRWFGVDRAYLKFPEVAR